MLRVVTCAALFAATSATSAFAQQAVVVGAPVQSVLRIGTEVPVKTRTELTTERKAMRVGQRFEVETSEPVMLNGQIVIPVGTPGVGEITSVRNKGMWGKSGHFDLQLLHLRLGGRQIRISGTGDDKGKAGGGAAVAVSALIFLPAGFFMTGTSARMAPGTVIKGFLAEDVPIAFAGPVTATPLMVAAPAPAASVTAPITVSAPVTSPAATAKPAVVAPAAAPITPVAAAPGAELTKVSAPQ